jgi:hypothetical protein
LIISFAGHVIHAFEQIPKIPELLKTLHNVIKAYRLLYLVENILHRNISKNNIIITDLKKIDDFTDMLINLNLVKKINSEFNNTHYQTNIMKFIIIKVLLEISHIY